MKKMAAKGGHIDFMFVGPPLQGRWIHYCYVRFCVKWGMEFSLNHLNIIWSQFKDPLRYLRLAASVVASCSLSHTAGSRFE